MEEARGPASPICHGQPPQPDKPCVFLCAVSLTSPGRRREQRRGTKHPKVVLLEFVSHCRNKARAFVNSKFNFIFLKNAVLRFENRILFEMSSVEKCMFDCFLKHLQFTCSQQLSQCVHGIY